MYLWLLLIISFQLWCQVKCPPSQKHGDDLAGKKQKTLKHEVFVKNRNMRRILLGSLPALPVLLPPDHPGEDALRSAASGSAEHTTGAPTTTDNPLITRQYWNRTNERCDYERIRCMRAYATGAVCARTLFYQYYSFPNYCALEFHNCVGRYESIWQVAYMGICAEIDIERQFYVDLNYDEMTNTSFLTQMYTEDSGDLTAVG